MMHCAHKCERAKIIFTICQCLLMSTTDFKFKNWIYEHPKSYFDSFQKLFCDSFPLLLSIATFHEHPEHAQEADFSSSPFGISISRAKVIDFTWPVWTAEFRTLAALGRPEIDPWGFLFPLAPVVWAAILTTMVAIPSAMFFFSSCLPQKSFGPCKWWQDTERYIRVLLQQGEQTLLVRPLILLV